MAHSNSNIHQAAHLASTRQLYGTGEYSDLLLCCNNGRKFRVHRSVLCPRSRFFSRACGGNFSEATTRTIQLAEDDPDTVARMLEYLYTLDYDDGDGLAGMVLVVNDEMEVHQHQQHHDYDDHHPNRLMSGVSKEQDGFYHNYFMPNRDNDDDADGETNPPDIAEREVLIGVKDGGGPDTASTKSSGNSSERSSGTRSALQNNALVYAMADKYEIVELKALAIERFTARAASGTGIWPVEDFSEIVRAVYEMTPDSDRFLRDTLIEICSEKLSEEMLESDEFKAIAVHFGAFTFDLMKYIVICR